MQTETMRTTEIPAGFKQVPSLIGEGEVYEAPFIHVAFQHGLATEVGINGCRVGDLLAIAAMRLRQYQNGPLACAENQEAIRCLQEAQNALDLRLKRREAQGVLNTMAKHEAVRTEDQEHDFSATGA